MAKEPRTKMSGKEARYILKQNSVNLAWLSEQLGILPQSLNSRLNAEEFKPAYMLEINQILKKDIFDLGEISSEIMKTGQQPILDIRVSAGYGNGLFGDESKVDEYVSIPSLQDCVGITVYGDSMTPTYRNGDVVFVRPIPEIDDIDYGRAYIIITRSDRLLKSIYPSSNDADCLRLVSANEEVNKHGDRLYPDRDIRKENVLFLYKVVGSLRRDQI
jgi:phage repressor protein C with HTH and peptisase S24 domain